MPMVLTRRRMVGISQTHCHGTHGVCACVLSLLALSMSACGGATPQQTTVRELEPLRIQENAGGGTTAYDAQTLFSRGLERLNSGACEEAVELYDQLADQFPDSRFRSPGLYNAGFCLQEAGELEEAATRYERLLQEGGTPDDEKHASFQLARVRFELDDAVRLRDVAERLLEREDLSSDERGEAMTRLAQGYLKEELLDEAERAARDVLVFQRTRSAGEEMRDNTFLAAAAFVLGETFRLRSQRIEVPPGGLEAQRDILEKRAQFLLDAQRAYFDTIGHGHVHWSSAAGYQIGAMYEEFWHALMNAPAPESEEELSTERDRRVYEEEYRGRLRELARPLLRHAVRYWELTLLMVERTRSPGPWSDRIRESLEALRARTLDPATEDADRSSAGR